MIKINLTSIYFKLCISLALMLLISSQLYAQASFSLSDFNLVRLDYNQRGMLILGFWALINIVLGGINRSRTIGQKRGFHEMNLYWNLVNFLIASFGYWQAKQEPFDLDIWQTLENQAQITKVLWFNFGLDLGYIAMGLFLLERGLRKLKPRWVGFGKSMILQGAFLFIFDGILVGFHEAHGDEIPKKTEQISFYLGRLTNF